MSSENWKRTKIGNLCNSISETHFNKTGRLIFLNTSDILHGKILHQNYSPVPNMPGQAKKSIQKHDILFSEIRPANGRWAYIDFEAIEYIVSTKLIVIRCNKEIHAKFFYYYLTCNSTTSWLQHLAESRSGTFPQITFDQISELEINLPPLSVQVCIANFINALDDKIELNRQTNKTLEEIAQTLFKEMCLPKGDVLPEGWRMGKVRELYQTTSGGTPRREKKEFFLNGTINWVKSKELGEVYIIDTEENITSLGLQNSSAKLLPAGAILLAMYGATVGEVSILSVPATCNQAICAITPKSNYPNSFVYEYIKGRKDIIRNMAVGAAQQNISQIVVQEMEIPIPPVQDVLAFDILFQPMYELIKTNLIEIKTLTTLRDTLLPKLMKGEIDIPI